jgi:hypothetical protein
MAHIAYYFVSMGYIFYYNYFIEANNRLDKKKIEKESSYPKRKKNKESIIIGPSQFVKLIELEDKTIDLEDLGLKI